MLCVTTTADSVTCCSTMEVWVPFRAPSARSMEVLGPKYFTEPPFVRRKIDWMIPLRKLPSTKLFESRLSVNSKEVGEINLLFSEKCAKTKKGNGNKPPHSDVTMGTDTTTTPHPGHDERTLSARKHVCTVQVSFEKNLLILSNSNGKIKIWKLV